MSEIITFLKKNENWLTRRLLDYAKTQHYNAFMPPGIEAWTKSIQQVTESISEGFKVFGLDAELKPIEKNGADPLAAFGIHQSKQHRMRGISLYMFLGFLKYFRQSYQDLIDEEGGSLQAINKCKRFIDRCFDRIEIALSTDWNQTESGILLQELQGTNRNLTNEKNAYLTIFESLSDPAILLDARDRIINMNHSAACLVSPANNPGENYFNHVINGASRRGFVEKPPVDVYIGKSAHQALPWLSDILEKTRMSSKGMGVLECELILCDELRHFEVSFSEMQDISDRISGMVLLLRDITTRKLAEKELQSHGAYLEETVQKRTQELIQANSRLSREIEVRKSSELSLQASEEKLARILDIFPDHVCIISRDRTIMWCNQATKQTFGKDVSGHTCFELYKGTTTACEKCVANDTNGDAVNSEQERLIVDAKGEEHLFWCTTTVSRRDRVGKPTQILKICRDITDRKQAERELRDHQRFIESIADATPDVLFIFDIHERQMVYSNQRILDHLGYSDEEIRKMGSNFLPKLLHPDDAERVERHLMYCEAAADDEVFEIDFRMMNKSGEWRWYSVRDKVFNRDSSGKGRQIIGVAHDISVRKDADERLWKYQQQLRNLAMQLSMAEEHERHHLIEALHDGIGQNLYALKMMLASLESLRKPGAQPGTLEKITELIDNTIDDARTLTFELNPPILYELGLPAAIDWLVGEYGERNKVRIRHESTVNEEHLSDYVRGLSYRAVRELLLNIEKHADADQASITSCCQEDSIIINVTDNGRGFDPLILKGEKGKYTGFGLFNIRERLEHLGGNIHVESARGKGTSVILNIPQDGPKKVEEEYNVHKGNVD